jgi:hypothetical protein
VALRSIPRRPPHIQQYIEHIHAPYIRAHSRLVYLRAPLVQQRIEGDGEPVLRVGGGVPARSPTASVIVGVGVVGVGPCGPGVCCSVAIAAVFVVGVIVVGGGVGGVGVGAPRCGGLIVILLIEVRGWRRGHDAMPITCRIIGLRVDAPQVLQYRRCAT